MTKQEQIEEIKQVLIKTCKRCRPFEEDYMQSRYAEALYNAGYRKTFTSELASDRQKAFKEGYEKSRKETAREILLPIYELCKVRGTITFDDLYFLYKREGVEVEE